MCSFIFVAKSVDKSRVIACDVFIWIIVLCEKEGKYVFPYF